MPSLDVDAAPVTHRRRSERTVGAQGAIPPAELFTPRTGSPSVGLPPGVVDTRPAGMRTIDIRDPQVDLRVSRPIDRHDLDDLTIQPDRPRRIDIRDGVDLHDGVLDTRPPGLRIVDVPLPTPEQRAPAQPDQRTSPYQRRSELRRQEAARSRRTPGSLSVPQVGIASALGLATIAAPLTGALSMPAMPSTAQALTSISVPAGDQAASLSFPMMSPAPSNAVEDLRIVTDDGVSSLVPAALLAPNRVLVTRASRSSERSVLPGCTGVVPAGFDKAVNGRLPATSLCTLWDKDFKLRADAAVAFAKLNVAYNQAFGHSICLADAYRTLSEQYAVKRIRGGFAATPGRSTHGLGLAVDLCDGSAVANTPTYTWLRANAPAYGWENPDWALPGGSGPYEAWHWEYLLGEGQVPGGD